MGGIASLEVQGRMACRDLFSCPLSAGLPRLCDAVPDREPRRGHDEGAEVEGKGRSQKTGRNYLDALSRVLALAVDSEVLEANPVERARSTPRGDVLSRQIVQLFCIRSRFRSRYSGRSVPYHCLCHSALVPPSTTTTGAPVLPRCTRRTAN